MKQFSLEYILYERLINYQGFTLDNDLRTVQDKGYFVSLIGTETQIPLDIFTFELMVQLINEYQKTTHLIGAWIDDNKVYFDCSILIQDLPTAINLAISYNQKAIYDNEAKKTIYIDSIT